MTKENNQVQLPNHIKEYLDTRNKVTEFLELFEGDEIDLRTELTHPEIVLVNTIILNSLFLNLKGIKLDIYGKFINQYMRLKVSKDRKSRAEFVDINKKERFDNHLEKFNSLQNLQKIKQ